MKLQLTGSIIHMLSNFASVFSKPTFDNFVFLTIGAIITNGSRTVTNILRPLNPLRVKHFTSYHNFLKRSECPLLQLAKILCTMIFSLIKGPIELIVDETLSRHNGPEVFGKSAHRDPIKSTKKKVQYCFGHKWVVMTVRFRLPGIKRVWALPCLAMLWLNEANCQKHKIRHRTFIQLTMIMLGYVHKWFPQKKFILSGDGGFASIDLTKFCFKAPWIELVSKLRIDAQLFGHPKRQPKRGRRRIKGSKLLSPQQEAKQKNNSWVKTTASWYGGTTKEILYLYRKALIYKPGKGVVEIAWILVRDPLGEHRDEAFYTTDLSMSPEEIIRHFVERWSIEVTFQESKRFIQIESTRNRKKESVLRSFPLLLGLFSIISLWYSNVLNEQSHPLTQEDWYQKDQPTFGDAMIAMRKEIWDQNIFSMSKKNRDMIKMPSDFLSFLSSALARTG